MSDRSDSLAADRRARRLAQREFHTPLLLEAGAGTGKTTTLVARVLSWSLGPGWDLHAGELAQEWRDLGRRGDPPADKVAAQVLGRVVAITFTEAAAAEMADRVARELAALARAGTDAPGWLLGELPADGERARRAAALLATLDHLVVRTIHAFCRGLLADHPLDAGLHPDLEVDADGLLLEEAAREAVEARLRTAYGEAADDNPWLQLAVRGQGPRELVDALVALSAAGVPADALDDDPLPGERVAALRRRLADAASSLAAVVEPVDGELGRSKTSREAAAAARRVAELAGDGGAPDLGSLVAGLAEAFPDNLAKRLADWERGRLNKTEAAAFEGREAELSARAAALRALLAHALRLDPELLRLAHRALAPLHRAVRRELRARGVVTFDDLLAEAAALLTDRPGVATRERRRIDQLLVDEFQDTDRLQCEIVGRLGLEGEPEHRPGLFLVGDPKQSIYGWRSADLAAYDAFKERLAEAGGRCLPLVENFRSAPPILEEVGRVVEPVMVERAGVQPGYQPLVACERLAGSAGFASGEGGVERAAVEHWVSWRAPAEGGDGDGEDDRSEDLHRTPRTASYAVEAAALARDLRDLHDREGVAWSDLAVLLRSTGDLDLYLEALRRLHVPYAVGRDKQYYRRREVIDAAALVRAVLDPGDHLALLTLLRSPLVGVPDAALIPLWNRQLPDLLTGLVEPDPERLAAVTSAVREAAGATPTDVPGIERVAGWETALLAAAEHLAVARRAFREEPSDRFVATVRHLFLPEVVESARYLGGYRLANLERFFRRLTTALEDGGGDVTAVLRALRRSVAEAREAPEGKPREGAEDAVQVMTIHQAKGLDFAHVYLPQLHRETGGGHPAHDVERTGDGFEMRLFGTPTLGYDRVEAARERVEAAERVRLLYVAMTRAEERLVLLGLWPDVPEAAAPEGARHLLHLAAHRHPLPELPLADRWEEARQRLEDAADPTGDGADGADAVERTAAATFRDAAGALWRFPALTTWPADAGEAEPRPDPPDPDRLAADATLLAERRREAAERRARPFSAAASEEAHHDLRQALASPDEETAERGGGSGGGREVAMAVGTAIHRLLEELDVVAEPAAEMERLRGRLPQVLGDGLTAGEAESALAAAGELLDRLAGGRLLTRLFELGENVLARELPVLAEPAPGRDGESGTNGGAGGPDGGSAEAPAAGDADGEERPRPPVGFVSGAVDLLYRDPEDGRLVVADHKTDAVEPGPELEERAAIYAPQGRTYVRAVARALELAEPPRFELWFLHADRIVTLDPEEEPPPPE